MEKLSGLVLDPGDDYNGDVLRSLFSSPSEVPELIKKAARLTPERLERLPDDLFAVVLRDGDVTLRKYAMADAGNTALSVLYFLKTAHRLPAEAQKVAATRLCEACSWYDLPTPKDLQKLAIGVGTALNLAFAPTTIKGTAQGMKQNLATAKASRGMVNPNVFGAR
jgi:hypothetical protein